MQIDPKLAVDHITPDLIEYIIQKIISVANPQKVIVFGSQARGDATKGSDLDLLIITRPEDDKEQIRLKIEQSLRGRRFGIDLLVRSPEDIAWNLDAENPLYTDSILREGRVVYEQ